MMLRTREGRFDIAVAHDGQTFRTADPEAIANNDDFIDAAEMVNWFEKTKRWLITWSPPTN